MPPDAAIRLRENQRRSRLRKKEYLTSLETRVRECESLGVAATVEVQKAARRVVWENSRLRELLRVKGVGEDEVGEWLRGGSGGDAREEVVGMLGNKECESGSSAAAASLSSCATASGIAVSGTSGTELHTPTLHPDTSPPLTCGAPTPPAPPTLLPTNSMPCEVAKSMLEALEPSGVERLHLEWELCPAGTVTDCVVDNGVVFQVLDRL
jgi:hypothetical protein